MTTSQQGSPAPELRVIGAGFGRTGTMSLREALIHLGYGPCDHMTENFEELSRFALWDEALTRKQACEPIDWRPLLTGYRAIVDWPGAFFWRELTAAHPDARVILTVRDPDRWYESCLATIFRARIWTDRSIWLRRTLRMLGLVAPPLRHGLRVIDGTIWEGTFHGRFLDRSYAQGVFAQHVADVQAAIPPERLLVFDVKQGWEPLCAFLGAPYPRGVPFPHANDAEAFRQRLRAGFARGAWQAAATAAVAIAAFAIFSDVRGRARRRHDDARR